MDQFKLSSYTGPIEKLNRENKLFYFAIVLNCHDGEKTTDFSENELYQIREDLDLIYNRMNVNEIIFEYQSVKDFICIFQCKERKRQGMITNLLTRTFKSSKQINGLFKGFEARGLNKAMYLDLVERTNYMVKNNELMVIRRPLNIDNYSRKDIELLDNPKNRKKWQKELLKWIFENPSENRFTSTKIKPADDREIKVIIDEKGKNGKSTLIKWLTEGNEEKNRVGYLPLGTNSQLKSALNKMGGYQVYLIDIPRSTFLLDYSFAELLCTLEDLKNGMVGTAFRGNPKLLAFDRPHIIIFSNNHLPYNMLSKDRWKIYEIKNDNLKEVKKIPKYINKISNEYQRELIEEKMRMKDFQRQTQERIKREC